MGGTDEMLVTLVVGPPCSGKTTYVKERWEPGDLVVEYDRLASALTMFDEHTPASSLHAYIEAARQAVLSRVARRPPGLAPPNVWVTTAEHNHVKYWAIADAIRAHDVVVLDEDPDECLRRLWKEPGGRDLGYATRGIEAWRDR